VRLFFRFGWYVVLNKVSHRSVAAGLLYFLLDQKVTKNQVSRKASLPHMAFALQIRQNLGPDDFAPLFTPAVHASAKS